MTNAFVVIPQFQARTTIAALWTSAMMCYIYADLIAFLAPGHLQGVLEGRMGAWTTTMPLLMGSAVLMSIPGVMISATFLVPSAVNRWLNIVVGSMQALIALAQIVGAWPPRTYYYMYFGVIEFALTLLIVWYAVRRLPAVPEEVQLDPVTALQRG
jgi:Family of unknown function (DUF6326)